MYFRCGDDGLLGTIFFVFLSFTYFFFSYSYFFFFFNDTATTEIYTLSLHDALPISDELLETLKQMAGAAGADANVFVGGFRERGQLPPKEAILRININTNPFSAERSEEHTSELQSQFHLVCRLLLEKKKQKK